MRVKVKQMNITKTKRTPSIIFDYNEFTIEGSSYPDNIVEFYNPIVTEIEQYLSICKQVNIVVNFKLNYFNSSSSRMIKKIILMFDQSPNIVIFNWHYNDQHMKDYGVIFKDGVKSTFNLIEVSDEQ
jgi:hypothetical protein